MAITLACIIHAPIDTVIQQFGSLFSVDNEGWPLITVGEQKCRMMAACDNKEETRFFYRLDKFAIEESKGRALLGLLMYCHRFPWRVRVLFESEIQVFECVHRDDSIQVTMTRFWKTATAGPSDPTTI